MIPVIINTTHARGYLQRTLDSVWQHGFEEVVISYENDLPEGFSPEISCEHNTGAHEIGIRVNESKRGAYPHFLDSAEFMLKMFPRTWDYVLMMQDDVVFECGGDLHELLKAVVEHDGGFGALSLWCPAIQHVEDYVGWYGMPAFDLPRKFYGALAVLFPRDSLGLMVNDPPGVGSLTKVDHWIGKHCLQHELLAMRPYASFCQHIGDESSVSDVKWDSPSQQQYRRAGIIARLAE